MHVIVWEFRVRAGNEKEFEAAYGPAGDWARLFGAGRGYRGTELYRDAGEPRRYLTIDRWESREAFEAFRAAHAAAYETLDRRFETLTERETPLGTFVPAG